MAGCSAVRRRRTCNHQHPRWWGLHRCQPPALRLPRSPAARPGSRLPAAPAAPSPPTLSHPIRAGGAPHLGGSQAGQGLTWKQENLALMFCSVRCSRACRKRMPRAHSPKRVEAPTTVLIQRATLSAEIWRRTHRKHAWADKAAGQGEGWWRLPSRTSPCPSLCPGTHVSRVVVPVGGQDQPQKDSDRPAEGVLESPQHQQLKLSPDTVREISSTLRFPKPLPKDFSSTPAEAGGESPPQGQGITPALPHLLMVIRGRQGQQQQQGPVLTTMGTSFRVLSTASFPPKPSTMTSIRR